ncbi:uncharacterized protein AB675_5680 [Cyphellophora attinorum]|uniref:Uncharacterized protein n=1 Tax=Cyphellophora attinorum TaxID=1664694 RepID=A0A0N0NNS8_9EURO|nr:uncharacterized protein AB675_5680 [Phialophora attinorum]KPI41898.1 hypothetical protein AB675_5680 [Phialophora attinorum]
MTSSGLNLSNLISSAKTPSNHNGTVPSTKNKASGSKSSIFTAHNKNVKKRAAADEQSSGEQRHKTSANIGRASDTDLHRSKRKMLEKTRLYNAMKRGEYLDQNGEHDRGGLVDFDKKWADSQEDHDELVESSSDNDSSDDNDNENPDQEEKQVQWLDEFSRLITGTPAQHRKYLRRQRIQLAAQAAMEDASARPALPSTLIYGDTIQTAAFNPDTVISDRMSELAAKRDKEATPPPETHYDGEAEIRTKGTGFYGFSKDEELRKQEQKGLEEERAETERKRKERAEKVEARRREVEERRQAVLAKKAEREGREVDSFLEGLGEEMLAGADTSKGGNDGGVG